MRELKEYHVELRCNHGQLNIMSVMARDHQQARIIAHKTTGWLVLSTEYIGGD